MPPARHPPYNPPSSFAMNPPSSPIKNGTIITSQDSGNRNQQPPKADDSLLFQSFLTILDKASQHDLNHFERAIINKKSTFGSEQLNTSIAAFGNAADDTSAAEKPSASTQCINGQQTTRATVASTLNITEANSSTSHDENLIKKRILSENQRGSSFDDRLRQKISSGQTEKAQPLPKPHTINIVDDVEKKSTDTVVSDTTFDDRLRQKLSSSQTGKTQPLPKRHTNNVNDDDDVEKKPTETDTLVPYSDSGLTPHVPVRVSDHDDVLQTVALHSEETQTQASSRALSQTVTRTDPELGEVNERHVDDPILDEDCSSINEGERENIAVDDNISETGVINASARCAEDVLFSQNVQQRSRQSFIQRISQPMMSIFNEGGEVLLSATLVGENEGEVVEATPVSFMERKWKRIALVTIIFLLLGIVVLVPTLLTQNKKNTDAGKEQNDPVVGTSDFMPLSSIESDDFYRMCMGGECPIGNLFTDALRWASRADFAVVNSGGVRGPGWPAGDVRMSDIRAAHPFEDYMCTGVMSGVSVFRLLNYSTALATFESSLTETGDRLLQMSGMKISYNTLLQGSGLGRLISVNIWDADLQVYLPLDHAKLYTFATDDWMCDHMDPFPSLFQTMGMQGEVPGSVDDQSINVQSIVGEYLTSLGESYNTTLRGSHVNDTGDFEPISFPTLDVVQDRGHIRCGFEARTIESGGYRLDLCRAVAAVLLGDPDKYEGVQVTGANRFQQLHERFIDIILYGDTHTVEREVRERTTNVGFAFSAPYYYDGMAYFEDEKRYDECADLEICVSEGTTNQESLEFTFPIGVILITSSRDEALEMLLEGNCNVIADDRSPLLDVLSRMENNNDKFVLGDKLKTKEPLAAVTRSNDQTFSDVVNWVMQALFYGEEKGLTQDIDRCQSQVDYITHPSSLNFLNAVYCVGNYGQIVFNGTGMNSINGGDSGMLYSIPFGSLDRDFGSLSITKDTLPATIKQTGLLGTIKRAGSLNCGVVIHDGRASEVNLTNTDNVLGMSIDYCRALAAAVFNGNYEAVNILQFFGSDASFVALSNGTIDVLAGARVELKRDIGRNATHKGFHFSSAYYFGNGRASDEPSVYSMATREGNDLFSSFVNCVVLATMYAEEEDIEKENHKRIPRMSLFGPQFAWSLRDAISYSGSYSELYTKNFGAHNDTDRGQNHLNNIGGPQIHSFPGLAGHEQHP